jgi:hypothetical protein
MDWSLEEDPKKISLKEQTSLLVFLDHCFTSMEVDLIRNQIQRLVSVSLNFFSKSLSILGKGTVHFFGIILSKSDLAAGLSRSLLHQHGGGPHPESNPESGLSKFH